MGQLEIVEFLQEENRVLREQLGDKRLRFTNAQRRRLRRNSTVLGQATYAPKYQTYRPNGDGCEPELEQARGDLMVAVP